MEPKTQQGVHVPSPPGAKKVLPDGIVKYLKL